MTLIKSISGIRGTIGGKKGDNLTPEDILAFTRAFALLLMKKTGKKKLRVVVGRDARQSGSMVLQIIAGTLSGMGIDVTDIGLATTPTVEIAVTGLKADGGIIITASHNPAQWNALKLLNGIGEFISAEEGTELLQIAEQDSADYAPVDALGEINMIKDYEDRHIEQILGLKLVDRKAIAEAGFKIAIDCVNSVGGIAVPKLLRALGVKDIIELNCTPDGRFAHNPEPLPENLGDICKLIRKEKADIGLVVDPDVDRLAMVCEDGTMFGEEYTLVAVSDYVLQNNPGNTVSNLSSTLALRDVTRKYGWAHHASAVGEVNVVRKMKEVNAVIGGEGNGGVIYPELHYGRDALVGIALFLTHLAKSGMKASELRKTYPEYVISKNKIELTPEINVDRVLFEMKELYSGEEYTDIDGLRVTFKNEWVHLRKSNTEPIIRIYAESTTKENADKLARKIMDQIMLIAK
ncbi:MAG: phosphoglucosamine mutase [Bacteroidota bacterium]